MGHRGGISNTDSTKLRPEITILLWGSEWEKNVDRVNRMCKGTVVSKSMYLYKGLQAAPDPAETQREGAGGSQEMRLDRQAEAGS